MSFHIEEIKTKRKTCSMCPNKRSCEILGECVSDRTGIVFDQRKTTKEIVNILKPFMGIPKVTHKDMNRSFHESTMKKYYLNPYPEKKKKTPKRNESKEERPIAQWSRSQIQVKYDRTFIDESECNKEISQQDKIINAALEQKKKLCIKVSRFHKYRETVKEIWSESQQGELKRGVVKKVIQIDTEYNSPSLTVTCDDRSIHICKNEIEYLSSNYLLSGEMLYNTETNILYKPNPTQ